ncbi:hypothetical protein A2U01_0092435, partial [Trifolium medium]|nr:hypothetical protein [Trifolium medium]
MARRAAWCALCTRAGILVQGSTQGATLVAQGAGSIG